MIPQSTWRTIERPGWAGEERDRRLAEYDEKYGKGNWRIRHRLGPHLLDFSQALRLYELCYEADFLHPDRKYLWNDLIKRAKDVWTEHLTDVRSGLDYTIQQAPANHYEDIAIRRIFKAHNVRFEGEQYIRIRADSEDVVGKALSSIHIPFIYPNYIEAPINDRFEWWNRHKGSLETYWHLNKELQVKDQG